MVVEIKYIPIIAVKPRGLVGIRKENLDLLAFPGSDAKTYSFCSGLIRLEAGINFSYYVHHYWRDESNKEKEQFSNRSIPFAEKAHIQEFFTLPFKFFEVEEVEVLQFERNVPLELIEITAQISEWEKECKSQDTE